MCLKNWVLSHILHKMLNLVFKSAQNTYEPRSFVELILVLCQTSVHLQSVFPKFSYPSALNTSTDLQPGGDSQSSCNVFWCY